MTICKIQEVQKDRNGKTFLFLLFVFANLHMLTNLVIIQLFWVLVDRTSASIQEGPKNRCKHGGMCIKGSIPSAS